MTGDGTTGGTRAIRTVLGDVDPADLGVCDAHDHLFIASTKLPGQELDDPAAATAELAAFAALGGQAVAQWTPHGLGRRVADVVAASKATGVHVIAATGFHQTAHYDPAVVDRVGDRFTELFISELTEGIRDDAGAESVRAGMIKVAGAFHQLDDHARRTMAAAAEAHHATDAPIAVHLEHGTAPLDVLDWLCDTHGVPPKRVILGHLNRMPDSRVHQEAARSGAFLAFDGPSRAHHATDWRLLDALIALAEAGHTHQLLLGGDTVTADARSSTGGGPGMPFLLRVLRPRIERELGVDAAEAIYVDNPARAFAARWR